MHRTFSIKQPGFYASQMRLLFLLFPLTFGPLYAQKQPVNLLSNISVDFLEKRQPGFPIIFLSVAFLMFYNKSKD